VALAGGYGRQVGLPEDTLAPPDPGELQPHFGGGGACMPCATSKVRPGMHSRPPPPPHTHTHSPALLRRLPHVCTWPRCCQRACSCGGGAGG
jgi:hypothetical protein